MKKQNKNKEKESKIWKISIQSVKYTVKIIESMLQNYKLLKAQFGSITSTLTLIRLLSNITVYWTIKKALKKFGVRCTKIFLVIEFYTTVWRNI